VQNPLGFDLQRIGIWEALVFDMIDNYNTDCLDFVELCRV